MLPAPTKTPIVRNNIDELDDLLFMVSKKKQNQTKSKTNVLSQAAESSTEHSNNKTKLTINGTDWDADMEEDSEESWVAGSGEAAFFLLDMHPDLGEPIEQLGIEIEQDPDDDNVTDFKQRFGEKLLWEQNVNVTALEEEDLRCGGLVIRHNMTVTEEKLKEWAEDCMVQKCQFIR